MGNVKKINRRLSSVLRDNLVHEMYREELERLGEVGMYVSKEYLYRKIGERTGLSVRSVSYILNHTERSEGIGRG